MSTPATNLALNSIHLYLSVDVLIFLTEKLCFTNQKAFCNITKFLKIVIFPSLLKLLFIYKGFGLLEFVYCWFFSLVLLQTLSGTFLFLFAYSDSQHIPLQVKQVCVCACMHLVVSDCDLMDCSPPGCSVHDISQARILEWIDISYFRGSSQLGDRSFIFCDICIGRWILLQWILHHCTT